jgi:methylated-DNA-[protein]-cysteine S-methyltransferase
LAYVEGNFRDATLATFSTAIGTCGIAWRGDVTIATCLPEESEGALLRRLAVKSGNVERGAPPPVIEKAIRGIVSLLDGARTDLGFIVCDYGEIDPFRARIYELTRTIQPGETMTYGEIAERLGNKRFAQAVGQAMGSNPLPIIVPCHRVMGARGRLTGFSANGGVATKVRMLEIEGALSRTQGGLFDDLPLCVAPAGKSAAARRGRQV